MNDAMSAATSFNGDRDLLFNDTPTPFAQSQRLAEASTPCVIASALTDFTRVRPYVKILRGRDSYKAAGTHTPPAR